MSHWSNDPQRLQRFWKKVKKANDEQCWFWTGAVTGQGYGNFWNGAGNVGAHIASWLIANYPQQVGNLVVRHKCNNALCVNPEHLLLGTAQENIHDEYANGNGPVRNFKIGQEIADRIRAYKQAHPKITQIELSEMFGISQPQVWRILHNEAWSKIDSK